MKLLIVAVGQRMPAWVESAVAEYARRMPRATRVEVLALRPEARPDGAPAQRALEAEETRIRKALPQRCTKVILDERGTLIATADLAARLGRWRAEGRDVAFIIGGADGLAEALKREADFRWSLSPLTLPHGLARIVVAEQLYRAASMLENHPYHRK